MRKKVAYLGIPGSFSYIAAKKYFRNKFDMMQHPTLRSVFTSITKGACEYAVVPLENTLTGSIAESYDMMLQTNACMTGEIFLKIHLHLLGIKGKSLHTLRKIRKCLSNPIAVSQCKNFFDAHPWIELQYVLDTATAAKRIVEENNPFVTALGSYDSAKIYGLSILKANIEDEINNFTRFAVISKKCECKGDKISLVFSVVNQPGSLYRVLKPYAQYGHNLTKIESRPVHCKPWEYVFYMDFEIGENIENAHDAVRQMKAHVQSISFLGQYRKGQIYET